MPHYDLGALSGEGVITLPSPQLVTIVDWYLVTPGFYTNLYGANSPKRMFQGGALTGSFLDSDSGLYWASWWIYLEVENASFALPSQNVSNYYTEKVVYKMFPGTSIHVMVEY